MTEIEKVEKVREDLEQVKVLIVDAMQTVSDRQYQGLWCALNSIEHAQFQLDRYYFR